MKSQIKIIDQNNKELICIKEDRILLARSPDMSDKMKKIVSELYELFTDGSDDIQDFLEFNEEEENFCS